MMERKEFIKKFAVSGSILLTAPVLFNSCSDEGEDMEPTNPDNSKDIIIDLNAASSANLGNVGGYIYSGSIIVFRTGETNYMALSKACTHQGCDVEYNHASGNVPCPCHGSKYTTAGVVTEGPATRNLTKYNVVKSGNTLKIS
ncbi:Rieske (2Fe-2S) protein [Prolixibacteraceae bacterium Z1-6]|uniref:Rieske (2Fe-2S) protein n=1 Tax=Draconibacterium aestuarii TaxID=2998507 RepID=A0A9X3F6T6_9BACT|nr:Rieske (2Fe-2S) protein [Prolixibacteraceae bacterium Z1-6]